MAMHWVRALVLAESLLKVVQANVAREARGAVKHQPYQENPMENESAVPGDPASIPAQAANPTTEAPNEAPQAQTQATVDVGFHAATAPVSSSIPSAIDVRIQNITTLVQVLSQNQQIQRLLWTLLDVSAPNQTRAD